MILNSKYFSSVEVTNNSKQYEKVAIALKEKNNLISSKGNVYDYDYIKIVGEFYNSGEAINLLAFWLIDYEIKFEDLTNGGIEINGIETVEAKGDEYFCFHFLPLKAGEYNLKIKVYLYNNFEEELEFQFNVANNDVKYQGFIQIDKSNNKHFIYQSGETYCPIGQNVSWYLKDSLRRSRDYDVWFSKMNEYKMNIARVWLAPWGFALHSSAYDNFDKRFDALARLDRLVEVADKYHIYFLLTLINHGQFSANINPDWHRNPWNKANGGILEKPIDFFSNSNAKRIYKNQLLYILARYSFATKILAWELFNEVDHIDDFDNHNDDVTKWHEEMAGFIKDHDPYKHLVTTSYKYEDGEAYYLDNIDFANPHNYGYYNKNVNLELPKVFRRLYEKYQKPILYSEFGVNYRSGLGTYKDDPKGIAHKQSLWVGMLSGGAGGAMSWWWDSYTHKYDYYKLYQGAGEFALKLNLNGSYDDLDKVAKVNKKTIGILGYIFNDRSYGYLFNRRFTHYQKNKINVLKDIQITFPLRNGSYKIEVFDTDECKLIYQFERKVNNEIIKFVLPNLQYDVAFIITTIPSL